MEEPTSKDFTVGSVQGGNVNIGGTQYIHGDVNIYPGYSEREQVTRKLRLFICYSYQDDVPFVEELVQHLKDDFEVLRNEVIPSTHDATSPHKKYDAIDRSDRVLLVVGTHTLLSSEVQNEWSYAYENYKDINIVVRFRNHDNVKENLPKQLQGFDILDLSNEANYAEQLAQLKQQLAQPVTLKKPFGVPPKPKHYLNRSEDIDALWELITTGNSKSTLISEDRHTTTIEGMGGIGKSVLAIAFAYDPRSRVTFPDGVVWLTVGRQPNMYELYRQIGNAVGDNLDNYLDEKIAYQNIQKIFINKKYLLILDDVWEIPVARAFNNLISETKTRLLLTTRNLQINTVLDANEYRLGLLSPSQAVDYLRNWVGDDPDLEMVAEKLGHLFLALKLAGARMKKDGLNGVEYLRLFDAVWRMNIYQQATDRDDSLEVSINLSVDAAFNDSTDDRLLFHTFGIYKPDIAVPQKTILQLWQYLQPDIAKFQLAEILNTLVDLSLVERHEDKTYTLHDLLHSYVQEKLGDRTIQIHLDLLSTYWKLRTGEGWETALDDGYIYNYLAYHLASANLYDDLRNLFLNDNWLQVRVEQSRYLYEGYLSDVMFAWNIAQARALEVWDERLFLDCARYALIVTKINDLSANYVPELVIRALQLGLPTWTNQRALSIASKITTAIPRLNFFIKLLNSGLFEGDQRKYCIENAIQALEEEGPSLNIASVFFEELASNLHDKIDSFRRLLNVLFAVEQDRDISRGIELIGKYIPQELLDDVLEKVLQLEDDFEWGQLTYPAIDAILERLNERQLEFIRNYDPLDQDVRALIERHLDAKNRKLEVNLKNLELPEDYDEFIDNLELEPYFLPGFDSPLDVLELIADKLTDSQLNKLIVKTFEFEDSSIPSAVRPKIFKILAPYLTEEVQLQVLRQSAEIDLPLGWEFMSVLESIVGYLSPKNVEEAYRILITEVKHDQSRGFSILAPVLNNSLLKGALKETVRPTSSYSLLHEISHFIPFMPTEVQWEIVRRIQSYIGNTDKFGSHREDLFEDFAKTKTENIGLVANFVRFALNQDLSLWQITPSLAHLSQVLQQNYNQGILWELLDGWDVLLEKAQDRDKPFIIVLFLSLTARLLKEELVLEHQDEFQENLKDTLIHAIERLLDWGSSLRPFFSALVVGRDHIDGERLDYILSLILECHLDYSNTQDLTYFSLFVSNLINKPEWIDRLIDQLIKILRGRNTNAPLLRSLLPAFSDNTKLLYKALHYADVLPYPEDRIVTLIHIARHLPDVDFRFSLISRELKSIQDAVEVGLDSGQIWHLARILESCGPILASLEEEFKVLIELVEILPSSYMRARCFASVAMSPYFNEELRWGLRIKVLNILFKEHRNSIEQVREILSDPSFLTHLALTPSAIRELYNLIIEIEEQWMWL